jgi:predicted transglutaminase-like cysteine proteinase
MHGALIRVPLRRGNLFLMRIAAFALGILPHSSRAWPPPARLAASVASVAGFVAAGALAQVIPDLGFTTKVSAALVSLYTRKFGPPVPDRLASWIGFAREQKAQPLRRRLDAVPGREAEILQIVNDAINRRMKWGDDRTYWGVDDYWATPAESIAIAGGDCEDFSLAKYYMLKELGVPVAKLRITYVRLLEQGRTAHMVLAYYPTPEAEPLILDNVDPSVRGASQRTDLEPVYSFNDDEVVMVAGGKGKPAQIRAWLSVQERLVMESRT